MLINCLCEIEPEKKSFPTYRGDQLTRIQLIPNEWPSGNERILKADLARELSEQISRIV